MQPAIFLDGLRWFSKKRQYCRSLTFIFIATVSLAVAPSEFVTKYHVLEPEKFHQFAVHESAVCLDKVGHLYAVRRRNYEQEHEKYAGCSLKNNIFLHVLVGRGEHTFCLAQRHTPRIMIDKYKSISE